MSLSQMTKILHLKYLQFNLLMANQKSEFPQNLHVKPADQTAPTAVPLALPVLGSMDISHLRETLLPCFLWVETSVLSF